MIENGLLTTLEAGNDAWLVFLNTLWLVLACGVAFKYLRIWRREKQWSPMRFLVFGVVLSTAGTVLMRLYWWPWYFSEATAADTALIYDQMFPMFGWMLALGMVLNIAGLFFHINLSFDPQSRVMIIRRSVTIVGVCLIPAIVAFLVR